MSQNDYPQQHPPPAQQMPPPGYGYPQYAYPADDEISLRDLALVIWQGKWWIIATTVLCFSAAVAYALLKTPEYQVDALLAPAGEEGQRGPSIPSGLGGLAGLAGISLPSVGSNADEAIALLKSRAFTRDFIEAQGIFTDLYPELWDAEAQQWRLEEGEEPPSENDAVRKFSELRSVSKDQETGMVTVSLQWIDRHQAAEWLAALIDALNHEMRERAIEEAQKSQSFLSNELERTSIVEVQQAIYGLMEEQVKKIMLANTRAQYAFKVLDPPVVPDEDQYDTPKRPLIAALGLVLGLMLGVMVVFVRNAFRDDDAA